MAKPRYRRRKEDRPGEIIAAALAAFSEKGFAATRVEDVARRAGISKGLLYLYFETKEELFRAVIRGFVVPRVSELRESVAKTELSAEAYFRGPFLEFIRQLPNSPAKQLVRLMISEGAQFPDISKFYWQNVVAPALETLRTLIRRGIANGEFQPSALEQFPQLLIAPVLLSFVWKSLFENYQKLDTDQLFASHIELMLQILREGSA